MLTKEQLAVMYKHGSTEHVKRAMARRNFLNFTQYTKPDFMANWHHQLLCGYLEGFARGLYPRLIIEAPPRHGKSELVSRRLPAYIFGKNPSSKVITASYGAELASSMNRDVQRIIDSQPYHNLFPETRLAGGQGIKNNKSGSWLRNSDIFEIVGKGGMYRSAGVGGAITGLGGDFCFPKGVKVTTPTGPKCISTLKIGDTVWGYDHVRNKPIISRVEAISARSVSRLIQVKTTSGREILCTPNHPFWVNGKGYEQAESLQVGQELIKADLPQNQKINLYYPLRLLQERIREIKGRLSKDIKKTIYGNVLFLYLLTKASRSKEQEIVPYLQENSNSCENTEILFSEVQAESSKVETDRLPILYKTISTIKSLNSLLFHVLQKYAPLFKNEWRSKSKVQGWDCRHLPDNLLQTETSNQTQRQIPVRSLWKREETAYSPHQREEDRQSTTEFNYSLSDLPYHSPQIGSDTVSSVTEIGEAENTVYDIQVEGCHNFFAETILVHNCIIDDPIKNAEEADSITHRQKVWNWYTTTFYTRLERNGSILITLTRWHEDDLAGRLLEAAKKDKLADQWVVLSLPAIAEGILDPEDPRLEGEALWPYKYDLRRLQAMKGSMGSRAFNALYQQKPAPEKGNIIDSGWFKYYRFHQVYDYKIMSWDCTFKDTESSDFVVGGVFGVKAGQLYLIDLIRKRMGFNETLKEVKNLIAKHPDCREVLIEDKANGTAVIETLRSVVPMLIPITPTESKISRANAASPFIEAGNLFLPDPLSFPTAGVWLKDFESEFQSFPNGAHDDQVDMVSQAINRFRKNASWMDALDQLESPEFDQVESSHIATMFGWNR